MKNSIEIKNENLLETNNNLEEPQKTLLQEEVSNKTLLKVKSMQNFKNDTNCIDNEKNSDNVEKINNCSILNENKENDSDKKYKSLGFWVGLLCTFVVITEILLNSFGAKFEVKVAVEVVSYILAFLVSIGVLRGSKQTKNITELKDDIQEGILGSCSKDVVNEENNTKNKNQEDNNKNSK